MENVVIIGSGPAGLTSAIYTARAALEPLLLTGLQPGGQLTTTTIVENWPGFEDGIDGNKLMREMQAQAEKMGTRVQMGYVVGIEVLSDKTFHVVLDDGKIHTKSVIIATGASALTLELPNKDRLMGYGLSTCATCDGFFYRNKKVAVIGGGDSAMEEASYLAKLASSVTLIHRRDKFRASKVMQDRVMSNSKINVILNSEVVDTTSDHSGLTGIVVKSSSGEQQVMPVDGLFMAIGHKPNTEFLRGVIELDEKGYVVTRNGTYTSVEGIFAAGDVEDKYFRQAITASGRGCQAAMQVEKYLEGIPLHM